jgi:hypothetical protein
VTEPETQPRAAARTSEKPTTGQRLAAFTFLGAFGLTVVTVVLTGLWVRSPHARRVPDTEAVLLVVDEPRMVNLAFQSRAPLADVAFLIELPPGIEVAGHPGQRRIEGRTRLSAGENVLPLTLVATGGRGGELAARLSHGRDQKTFVVVLRVAER